MADSTRQFFIEQFEAFDQSRWPSGLPVRIGMKALDVIDNAASIAEKASNNPHLNDAGKAAARQAALEEHFEEVERAGATLDAIEREADKALSALAVPAVDKTDLHSCSLARPSRARWKKSASSCCREPRYFSGIPHLRSRQRL